MGLFVFDLWENTCQRDYVTSSAWPLTLEVIALHVMRLFMLQLCTKFELCRASSAADITHFRNQHWTSWWPWPLTLWPWNCWALPMGWATLLPILVFLLLFILDLWAIPSPVRRTTWPCDLNVWPWRSWRLSVIWVFVLHLCSLPSLNFVGLPIRKIYSTFGVSTLWPLTLKLARVIARAVGN